MLQHDSLPFSLCVSPQLINFFLFCWARCSFPVLLQSVRHVKKSHRNFQRKYITCSVPFKSAVHSSKGSGSIALLILNLGARRGWVFSTTPQPIYPRERPGNHCTGCWVGPRAGLDVCVKSLLSYRAHAVHKRVGKCGIAFSVLEKMKYDKLVLFFGDAWFILSRSMISQNNIQYVEVRKLHMIVGHFLFISPQNSGNVCKNYKTLVFRWIKSRLPHLSNPCTII
jgi:hypothetical protein